MSKEKEDSLTPCEKLGYKVGDTFLKCKDDSGFRSGSLIELIKDDGSECPEFKLVSGFCSFDDNISFECLEYIKKVSSSGDEIPETAKSFSSVYKEVSDLVDSKSVTKPESGVKYDDGKLRYSLLPKETLDEVVKVLEFGSRKYAEDNWQKVPQARTRYYDAMNRHIQAWWNGEETDKETGCSHLAHAVCCSMFLMWFDKNKPVVSG